MGIAVKNKKTQKITRLNTAKSNAPVYTVSSQHTNTTKLVADKNSNVLNTNCGCNYRTKQLKKMSLKFMPHDRIKQNYTKPETWASIVNMYRKADNIKVGSLEDNNSKGKTLFKCSCRNNLKKCNDQELISEQKSKLKQKRKPQITLHKSAVQNNAGDNESFQYSEKFKKMSANGLKKIYKNMQNKLTYPYEEPKKDVRLADKKSLVNLYYKDKGKKNVKYLNTITSFNINENTYCLCSKTYQQNADIHKIDGIKEIKPFAVKLKDNSKVKFEKKPRYITKDVIQPGNNGSKKLKFSKIPTYKYIDKSWKISNNDKSLNKSNFKKVYRKNAKKVNLNPLASHKHTINRNLFESYKNCSHQSCKDNNVIKVDDKAIPIKSRKSQPLTNKHCKGLLCNNQYLNQIMYVTSFLIKCLHKLKLRKLDKQILQEVEVQNESDHTGEPLFEMQINSVDMCVLNAHDIKNKIKSLGKETSRAECICPSHGLRKKYIDKKEFCASGVYEKVVQNKKTNFNCKCVKVPNECTDVTCNIHSKENSLLKSYNIQTRPTTTITNKQPLFVVKLDSDKMCVINSKEIQDKLINIKNQKVEKSVAGICAEKNMKNRRHICNCIKSIKPYDCSENTCRIDTYQNIPLCTKCKQYRIKSKMVRRNIDTQTIKSKLSCFFATRTNPDRRMYSQSVNIHKRNDLNKSKQLNIKGMQHKDTNNYCTCCHCKINRKRKRISICKHSISTLFKRGLCSSNIIQNTKYQSSVYPFKCECNQDTKKLKIQPKKIRPKYKQSKNISLKDRNNKKQKKNIKKIKKRHSAKLHKKTKTLKNSKEQASKNCCINFIESLLTPTMKLLKGSFGILLKKGPSSYIKKQIKGPKDTYKKIKTWMGKTWDGRRSQMAKTLSESETLNILTDTLKDTDLYQTFAPSGKSAKDKRLIEIQNRKRKRRIKLRHDKALYSCRHMFLTTLRKRPCMFVYHICPCLYPQCLGLLSFMRSFFNLCVFIAAFACWTPCIVFCELTRALCCCVFCT
ncbi:uncharacterized protein LOC116413590 [Galleria mellonella]|uniref:Uncharacterized protein LOC116413590 n=1 Tax=Galleria mellonella TaxID=7137 RepID=A0ABM3MHC1_GALME|nr:uncharacterized protein LOC116413590 [Galleria mellonella]